MARLDDFAIKNVIVGSAGGSGRHHFRRASGFPRGLQRHDDRRVALAVGNPEIGPIQIGRDRCKSDGTGHVSAPLGIESQLRGGELKVGGQVTLSQSSDGGFSGGASLKPVVFSDGQELLSLDSVDVAGLTLSADATRIGMKQLQIAGPRTRIVHEADGAWRRWGSALIPERLRTAVRRWWTRPRQIPSRLDCRTRWGRVHGDTFAARSDRPTDMGFGAAGIH